MGWPPNMRVDTPPLSPHGVVPRHRNHRHRPSIVGFLFVGFWLFRSKLQRNTNLQIQIEAVTLSNDKRSGHSSRPSVCSSIRPPVGPSGGHVSRV